MIKCYSKLVDFSQLHTLNIMYNNIKVEENYVK